MSRGPDRETAAAAVLRLAARGTALNYAGSVSVLVAQVGYTAATARLITPAGFGAYAIAQAGVGLAGYFTLSTLGAGLMRLREAPRQVVGTSLALAIAGGSLMCILGASLAPLWASEWGAPSAGPVLRVLSLVLFANTVAVIPLALLRRDLQYGTAAAVEAGSQLAAMLVGVALAFALRSPIALALSQVVGAFIALAWALLAARRKLALSLGRREARSLLQFAGQVSGQNLVYYTIYTAPSWAIAHFDGSAALGFYSRAYFIVMLPTTHLAFGLTKALYPLYPRVAGDSVATKELLTSTLRSTVLSSWPAFGAVAGSASILVATLLGAGWDTSATLLPIVAAYGMLNLPTIVLSNSAEAFGWMRSVWTIQMLWIASVVAGLGLAVNRESLVAFSAAILVAQSVAHASQLVYFVRRHAIDLHGTLVAYSAAALLFGAAFAGGNAVEHALAGMTLAARITVQILAIILMASLSPAASFSAGRRRRRHEGEGSVAGLPMEAA